MVQKNAIEIAKEYLQLLKTKKYVIKQAFLFGSYSNGVPDEYSDIDIALVIEGIKNEFEEQVELMKIRRQVDLRIEPHPFSPADFDKTNPFVNEILRKGTRLV